MDKRGRYAQPINPTEEKRVKPPMITVRLSIEQFNEIVDLSRRTKKSLNAICLEALEDYSRKIHD
jgi:hypothetical protein